MSRRHNAAYDARFGVRAPFPTRGLHLAVRRHVDLRRISSAL